MSNSCFYLLVGSFQPQFKTSLMADTDIDGVGNGIYRYMFDESTGNLTLLDALYGVINPAHFYFDSVNDMIYASSDTNDFINWQAGSGGGVYTLKPKADGELDVLASQSSCGVRAIGLCGSRSGKYLAVLNQGTLFCTTQFSRSKNGEIKADIQYDEKNLTLFSLNKDGTHQICDRYVLPNSESAIPKAIRIDKDDYLYVVSDGTNDIDIFNIDEKNGRLVHKLRQKAAPKCGLSDIALHPSLPVFYSACQESGDIQVYHFNKTTCEVALIHTAWEEEPSNPELILINKSGSHLYSFDAKNSEIKVYAISQEGKLILFQRKPLLTDTKHIYSAVMSPAEQWLLFSDVQNNTLHTCSINEDGSIGDMQAPMPAKTPTGLLLI